MHDTPHGQPFAASISKAYGEVGGPDGSVAKMSLAAEADTLANALCSPMRLCSPLATGEPATLWCSSIKC